MPRPKRIRFLDIGCGKAERIAHYARRPRSKDRQFVGIDLKKRAIIPSRQHNVKIIAGNAVKRMKKFKAGSFDVINMDFFPIANIFREVRPVSPIRMAVSTDAKEAIPGLLKEMHRVLADRGKLYLTVPEGAISGVDTVLSERGFDLLDFKEVPEKDKNSTGDMRKHFEMAKNKPEASPFRIIAVKRRGWQ